VILVDTTVWIDFFADRVTSHATHLKQLLEEQHELCICGPILTEILQGIRNTREHNHVQDLFGSLLFLDMHKDTFILAAEIYRKLRLRGITVRKTIDCMIAAVAVEYKAPLLHNDRDFDPIAKYCGLKISR
jgi:predicted nucleic acid-binding protein